MQWALVLAVAVLAPPGVQSIDLSPKQEKKAANLAEFKSWFKMVGGKAHSLELVDTGAKGFGVEAQQEIQEGDELISMPFDAIFCRRTLLDKKSSELRGVSPQARSGLSRVADDHDLLMLLLIRERALGEKSYYAPYMKLLPKRALSLVSAMTDAEQRKYLDDATYQRAKAEAAKRKTRHRRLREPLKGLLAGIEMSRERMEEFLSLEAFIWADGLVASRAITLAGEGKFIVPFADMINYAPHPEARARNFGTSFQKSHRIVGGTFLIMADRYTAQNQEILEDYGENDSELYFHSFGFLPQENPFDCVTIRLPAPKMGSKQRILVSKLRVPLNPEGCVRPGTPLQDELLYHLYMLKMSDEHAAKCGEHVAANPNQGAVECFAEDPEFSPEVAWKDLLEIIRQQLDPDAKKEQAKDARKQMTLPEGEDTPGAKVPFAPNPNKIQKLIEKFALSRDGLLRAMLEAPPPTAVEGPEEPDKQDASTKGKTGELDELTALEKIIYDSTEKYIGAIHAAQKGGQHGCNQSLPDNMAAQLRELYAELGGALSISDEDGAGAAGDDPAESANEGSGSVASEGASADSSAGKVEQTDEKVKDEL